MEGGTKVNMYGFLFFRIQIPIIWYSDYLFKDIFPKYPDKYIIIIYRNNLHRKKIIILVDLHRKKKYL